MILWVSFLFKRKFLLENIHCVCNNDTIISLNECNFFLNSSKMYYLFSEKSFAKVALSLLLFCMLSHREKKKVIVMKYEDINLFLSPVMNSLRLKIF